MNNWNLIILKKAEKYLQKLSLTEQKRIIQSLKLLIQDKSLVEIKPLKGRLEWRLRVGDFPILYREDRENQTYVVTKIKSRGDIYQ
ncbi:type II toxin-antitoxin system RelE/ParE family toxin [Geminocystis sp. GBBB08]|uniref:type II toxin-antitoxin system RelE family toxin n=1 Tax=Geminocystis sp. GBBB08 TaxID=2604140 RepID=UPI0027E35215|nr:type II toxin-antitoxin system RelE/ParE family toxin [Geminocystis sp. GBBB08]